MRFSKVSAKPLYLNIASSRYVLEGFENLDTSIFFHVARLPHKLTRHLLPAKYHPIVADFRDALSRATVRIRDCRKPLPYPNGSVDHILCSHFLEHIYPNECAMVLREFWRVLKRGGTAHIIVPDLNECVQHYLTNSAAGNADASIIFMRESILGRETRGSLKYQLMEATGFFGLQHRWMYDRGSMEKAMEYAGFEILLRNTTPSANYRIADGSVHVVGQK